MLKWCLRGQCHCNVHSKSVTHLQPKQHNSRYLITCFITKYGSSKIRKGVLQGSACYYTRSDLERAFFKLLKVNVFDFPLFFISSYWRNLVQKCFGRKYVILQPDNMLVFSLNQPKSHSRCKHQIIFTQCLSKIFAVIKM